MEKSLSPRKAFSRFGLQKVFLTASLALFHVVAHAQGGAQAVGKATAIFKTYQQPVQTLLYTIAAIITLIGAFNIYFKMQNGDQDVKKSILMTVGGCVAFIAMAQALPAIFG